MEEEDGRLVGGWEGGMIGIKERWKGNDETREGREKRPLDVSS